MNRRWIITGANGYLGGEFCRAISQRGETVIAAARNEKKLENLSGLEIESYNYQNLANAIVTGDIFVHCAGKTGSSGIWEEFSRVNYEWSIGLFDQAAEKDVSCFVYISSVAALGYRNRPQEAPLDEEAKAQFVPGEFYGHSKCIAEEALQKKAKEKNIRLIILRPGLIYGHRWFGKKQTWIRRGFIIDPYQRIPLIHIDNFLHALLLLVSTPSASGTYLVVDDEQPTLKELNKKKIEFGLMQYQPWRIGKMGFWILTGMRMAVRKIRGRSKLPQGYDIAQYYVQTRRLQYSTKKLKLSAGWKPLVGLTDGLAECASHSTQNNPPIDQDA